MQRLTLILSDLYLPEGNAGGEAPRIHDLPALSGLLRVAGGPEHIGDWRTWLLREIGGRTTELPPATAAAAGRVSDAELETAWLATPDAYAGDDKERLRSAVERQGELTWQLARLETEWLEAEEALARKTGD